MVIGIFITVILASTFIKKIQFKLEPIKILIVYRVWHGIVIMVLRQAEKLNQTCPIVKCDSR